jgi:hypothetical protein
MYPLAPKSKIIRVSDVESVRLLAANVVPEGLTLFPLNAITEDGTTQTTFHKAIMHYKQLLLVDIVSSRQDIRQFEKV